ncbi:MAG: type II toxin-antitoxin system HicA family toxin [Dehalococcoidia bacterium]
MTALERSTARLLANPVEADFNDVRRVLEGHGWEQARQKGSHISFTKSGERPIIVSLARRRVKRAYVAEVCKRLGISQ